MSGRIIAIYKDYLRSGRGADRAIAAFVNAMAERGHEMHVLTRQSPTESFSVTFHPSVICHHVCGLGRHPVAGFVNKLFLRTAFGEAVLRRFFPRLDLMRRISSELRACVNRIRPDVVVLGGTNECVEMIYDAPLGVPVVQMFHVYPPTCFAKNKYQRVTRLVRAIGSVNAVQVLLPSYRATVSRYTRVEAVSIGNSVRYPADDPVLPVSTRDHTIVYVAYFTKDKNQSDLIEAFALLKNPGDWQLHFYGSGTPEWEHRLKERIRALGLEKRVLLRGETPTARHVYRHAGICAFPSKCEGLPLALIEAMWCGLPCVGFRNAPGVNELIVDGANGLLADPTPEAMAAQLDRLIADEALRDRLGTYAARTARVNYRPERIWQQWEDLIDSLCRAAASKPVTGESSVSGPSLEAR